jgi:peroxiredoxin
VTGCKQKQVQIKIGDVPPKFTLPDLKGNKVTVPDEFKGKVLIIRFWADWCTYCAEEMPAIDVVYNKYKENGVLIFAVNVGQPKEVAEAFVKNLRISYPVLLDTYSIVAKQYGVVGLPTTFIFDRKGIIREKILGEGGRDSFENMVVNIL